MIWAAIFGAVKSMEQMLSRGAGINAADEKVVFSLSSPSLSPPPPRHTRMRLYLKARYPHLLPFCVKDRKKRVVLGNFGGPFFICVPNPGTQCQN
jgi:hypothetical protein